MNRLWTLLCLGLGMLSCGGLAAQEWGREHRHSHSRGGSSDRGYDPDESVESRQYRFQRSDGFIRYLDTNNDGTVDESEVSGPRRYIFERAIQRAGLEAKFPLSISQLRQGAWTYYGLQGSPPPPTTSSQPGMPGGMSGMPGMMMQPPFGAPGMGPPGMGPPGWGTSPWQSGMMQGPPGSMSPSQTAGQSKTPSAASTSPTTASLVPGFGPQPGVAAVPGFGVPTVTATVSTVSASRSSSSSAFASSSSSGSPGGPSASIDSRVREYAAGLLKQYDANKNGKLEKDEWKQMRGDPQAADRDGDGVITLDELSTRLAASNKERSGAGSKASDAGARKGYRFLTAAERLPQGLPEWFAGKDANGDGQVSMAEYARSWTDAVAAEFARYDLNNDGLITPQECLAKANR